MNSAGFLYKVAIAHVLYAALAGAGVWLWLRLTGVEAGLTGTLICSLPALLGAVLMFTSQQDQEQYVVRLMAAALFTPILLLFWSNSAGLPMGRMLAAGFVHLLCFAAAVLWIGTRTTRVPPAEGVPAVDGATLQARLLSLNATGAPLSVSNPAAGEVIVVFRYRSPERSYRILLNLDPAKQQVRVRERASASEADPESDRELSMRSLGDPAIDPTRPDAQKVSERVAQVTQMRPAELAAMPATPEGTAVAVPAGVASALDERGVATLVCAVVTRSGWFWQPAFFGAQ